MKAGRQIQILSTVALILLALDARGQIRAVIPSPASSNASRYSSPAVDAGDYIYLSGQGPQRRDGSTPDTFAGQVHQALDNLEAILEATRLTGEHIVYMQIYLEDISKYDEMDRIFGEYFPKTRPARAVLGVASLPEPAVEINAVAVRDLTDVRAITPANYKPHDAASAGILTHDRLFVSGVIGSDPATGKIPHDPAAQVDLALDGLETVLKAAGLAMANLVFVNPYLSSEIPNRTMNQQYARRFEFGNTPARATIEVTSLPQGAHIEFTGVAVRNLAQRKAVRPKNMPPSPTASPCVFAADTLYCSAKDGFIPGPHGGIYATTTQHQLRQTMRNLLDNLEEAEMNFDDVVSTNIYLDRVSDQPVFNPIYAEYFGPVMPAATTIQQIAPIERKADKQDHFPGLEQVSLVAVRKHSAR